MATQPEKMRAKPLREKLQEANNANIVQLIENGSRGIDLLAKKAVRKLEAQGIAGTDEIVGDVAGVLKKLLVRGISK